MACNDLSEMSTFVLDDLLNSTLLDETYTRITGDGDENPANVMDAMADLRDGLQARRRNSSDQEWDEFVYLCMRHPLQKLVHQDPFTYRACEKPRGYAGDAETIDFIYGREDGWPAPEGTSPIGRMIFDFTTKELPATEGVRARRRFVAEFIDRLALEQNRPHVISIAAGHLREVNLSGAVRQGKLGRFVALDADTESLEEVNRCYSCYGVEVVPASVRRLLTGRLELGSFDLIYSTGLFDYLQQNTAQRLVSALFRMLHPGGRVVVANFLPGINSIGYMESYMDWKLIYRTPQEMLDVAMTIPQRDIQDIRLFAEENQNIMFLEVRRRGI